MKNESLEMSTLSVEKLVNQLSKMYVTVIRAGLQPKILPPCMLWGPPGVGKSQSVKEFAKEIEYETGKKVIITDVRLSLFNPIDLRGIPTANADKTLAVWLKPQIFQMNDSNDVVNILFLDEINTAAPAVMAAGYQITLDRTVGEHKLPDNCIVIAAGNRVGVDKSVANKMPKALANRLCHFEVVVSFDSWKKWAIANGINEKIIGFLSFRPDYLNTNDPSKDDMTFATPRSWEMVSNILNYVDDEIDNVIPAVSGCIGNGVALEFQYYAQVYHKLPNIEDIFLGKSVSMPTSPDVLYALVSAMTAFAREHKDNYSMIGNSIYFAQAMPADFTMLLCRSYMAIEKNYIEKLKKVPEFYEFLQKKGAILNGAI